MSTASAPGKIILFGEHAVVYGRPALAVPVTQVRASATVSDNSRGGIRIEAPNINLSSELSELDGEHPLVAVITGVFSALGISPLPACTIYIQSTIPVASGLGSGAAVSVAIIRALSEYLGQPLSDERVSTLAYEVEKLHHGTPSGIDNTVISYGRPVYFTKGLPIETLRVGRAFTLMIADTGMRAPTKGSVGDVRKLWQADKSKWEGVFDKIADIVKKARKKIEIGDWVALGALMNANHELLVEMTVSNPELDKLVKSARTAGALGAKLSGGGRGGNMITLIHPEQNSAVAQALRNAGARHVITTIVE
jgi:mevalonate kinase